MLTTGQLKGLFSKYSFRPLKRFGENYLIDANIKDKVIGEAAIAGDDIVLEIGPGFGALTMDLAKRGARIFAVEKDRKAYSILSDIIGSDLPNLKLFCGDILEFGLDALPDSKKIKVVGNLPYYITTPIIEYLIGHKDRIDFALIMVQKEVADRLLAGPGSKEYASISCFLHYHTKPRYICTVRRGSFYPSPEVDSRVLRLDMLQRPSVDVRDEELFFRIVRGAFNQRRKSIINSLSREEVLDVSKEELSSVLKLAGVDPASRPETLSLLSFAKIANVMRSGR